MALPLIASLIPAAYQLGSGIYQGIKAANMNPVRPTYDIPQSEKDALLNAKVMGSLTRLPGQTTMEQNQAAAAGTAYSQAREAAQDPNSLLSSISKIGANEMAGQRQIGTQAAQQYNTNQAMLRGALGRYGQFEDKQWQLNEMQPFMDEAKAQAALIQAQNQNIYGATTSAANTITQNEQLDLMKDIYLNPDGSKKADAVAPNLLGKTSSNMRYVMGPNGTLIPNPTYVEPTLKSSLLSN